MIELQPRFGSDLPAYEMQVFHSTELFCDIEYTLKQRVCGLSTLSSQLRVTTCKELLAECFMSVVESITPYMVCRDVPVLMFALADALV